MNRFRYIFLVFALCGLFASAENAAANSAFQDVGAQDVGIQNAAIQEAGVSIRTIDTDSLSIDPGKVATFVYEITSTVDHESLTPELKLPDSWTAILGLGDVRIDSRSSTVRLITIKVPSSALAGSYSTTLSLSNPDGQVVATHETIVSVKSIYAISLYVASINMRQQVE